MSSEVTWRAATLGLGGNLGEPPKAMAEALRLLDARDDCVVEAVSRLYRTPPWGKTDQAWFYNACAKVETTLAPEALLDACLDIERSMKRVRDERWGPRTLDIDVLTFEDVAQSGGRLELPHPRMTERGFVLMPLADFAADMAVGGRSVGDWLQQADVAGIEVADDHMSWWRAGA
ncbi:2-amino-4-hydroxy-6-hydroxymethyldihydropteridine diphosphokinase [Ensifer sp. NPDC090286]|uniref:2-amino-4-hydroxy-6- hydroxymethyldihydropteridine diphosphokinase n=1 Tax=Ensifer sp. NPDC090286 TaxID=3363991 RepID=UPI00383A4FCC